MMALHITSRVSHSPYDQIFCMLMKYLALCKSAADGFQGVIISIGPHTNAALDQFGLDDNLVLHLHVLTHTVHDTKQKQTLQTVHWGLNYEQAVNLADTMKHDTKVQQGQPVQVSHYHYYLLFLSHVVSQPLMSCVRFSFSLFFLALLAVMFAYVGLLLFKKPKVARILATMVPDKLHRH